MNGKTGKTVVLLAALLAMLLAGIPAYGGKSPDTSAGSGPKGVVTHSLPAGTKLHGTLTVEYEYAIDLQPPIAYFGCGHKLKAYLRLLKNSNLQTFYLELPGPEICKTISLEEALATQELLMPPLRTMIIERFFPQEPGLCLFLRSASNFSEWFQFGADAPAYGKYVGISDVEFAVNDNGGYCPPP